MRAWLASVVAVGWLLCKFECPIGLWFGGCLGCAFYTSEEETK